ncbi:MAG: lipoyl domain-containing protein [Nannocystaceae bacterium]|nr:lipoyl domain-containing protein [Nannocystaceae bacterium]
MTAPTAIVFELGDENTSGRITRWYVSEGDQVESGQRLFEVETDKAVVEVLAPAAGAILEIAKAAGSDIEHGDELGWIGDAAAQRVEVEQVLRVRVHTPCPSCGSPVALNGPWLEATCERCGFHAPLAAASWTEAFRRVARGDAFTRIACGPWRWAIHGEEGPPRCHNCATPLRVTGRGPMHAVLCGACGLSHDAAPPPPWLRVQDPTIVRVVGNTPGTPAPRPRKCGHCDTPVHPGCTASVPRCAQCGRDVVVTAAPSLARAWAVILSTSKPS